MKNINLKNKDLLNGNKNKSSSSAIFAFVILFLSLSSYGVIFLLDSLALNNIKKIKGETLLVENSLNKEEFKPMYFFNMKLVDLESVAGEREFLPQTKNIITISKNTLPEVHFSSLTIEDNGSSSRYFIEAVFPDNNILIEQIKAYKEMEDVNNFFLTSSMVKDDILIGTFSFDLGEVATLEKNKSQETF